jgi:hypothetical protein
MYPLRTTYTLVKVNERAGPVKHKRSGVVDVQERMQGARRPRPIAARKAQHLRGVERHTARGADLEVGLALGVLAPGVAEADEGAEGVRHR